MNYPSHEQARRDILEVGRRMYNRGYVVANDGNITCKVSDDTLWTTPTGVSKGFMSEDMQGGTVLDDDMLLGHERAISVDSASPSQLGRLFERLRKDIDIMIDHHGSGTVYAAPPRILMPGMYFFCIQAPPEIHLDLTYIISFLRGKSNSFLRFLSAVREVFLMQRWIFWQRSCKKVSSMIK